MIFVFTGNGKGKTTAALGQVLRMIGHGEKAAVFQFIKSKDWQCGEDRALKFFGNKVKLVKGGKGFVGILGDKLPFSFHRKAAKETLNEAKKAILSKKYKLIVLDEINVAVSLGLLKTSEVLKIIKVLPAEDIVLILTGRGAKRELMKIADLVTEFREIKHPFQKGILGKKGIEC